MSLRSKILLCALGNFALLGAAFYLFASTQLDTGLQSLLLAPGETRLRDLGDRVGLELASNKVGDQSSILERHAKENGVDLVIVDPGGRIFTGTITELPREVRQALEPVENPFRAVDGSKGKDRDRDKDKKGKDKGKDKAKDKGKDKEKGPHDDPFVARQVFAIPASSPPYWFGVRTPLASSDTEDSHPAILVIRAKSILGTPLLFDPKPWLAWLAVAIGIGLLCWFPLVHRITQAIRQLTAGAEKMAVGNFEARVPDQRRDELGHLGGALNRMSAQLHGFVYGQRRFLGDVAHELSAPIARAQVALGILEDRTEGKQREYALSAQEEVAHMSGLVAELLNFSRAGLEPSKKAAAPVDIGETVRRVIEREAGETAAFQADVSLTEGGELEVLAHGENLFRALSNLVRNAVRYAGEDGPVTIAARREGGDVLITVSDNGPGLPDDALDRVFLPFFRLDDSRTASTGGTGLGLAIVKTCVESSGGSVWCKNRSPRGLEAIIRLPAA